MPDAARAAIDDAIGATRNGGETMPAKASTLTEHGVQIASGRALLDADLVVPRGAHGIVLFAHGSGSSRFSSRNRAVAEVLTQGGFATLLLDLLTSAEDEIDRVTAHLRFDIPLLAERLVAATEWARRGTETRELPIGYFGASTGAAAALVAATQVGDVVRAIVSRGGRPDLAGHSLRAVHAPTLLIVGGYDPVVLDLNREAFSLLPGQKRLEIVPHASHLFEEPGAMMRVASLARHWFAHYLVAHDPLPPPTGF
jgi:pimeloyl-ACP methyl ester carboxylesterase